MSELIGSTLGRYKILERIGQGGMAEVYKGYQPLLDRYVAVKVLHAFMLTEAGSQERFQREARAVAALRHPNIVQVFDFDVANNVYFMVMEYVAGKNLKMVEQEALDDGRLLNLEDMRTIISRIGHALGYAHSQGMIHRDVKPQNILLRADGQPLLTDFGIAKIIDKTSISDPNTVAGTPAYMSPEQARGDPLDKRADLYSLGVVLYELVTGVVPFEATTPWALVHRHIHDPVPLPRARAADFPAPLEQMLVKAMAKAPADRYQTAEELVTAFQEATADAVRQQVGLKPLPAVRAPSGGQVTPSPRVATGSRTPIAGVTPPLGVPAPAVADRQGAGNTPLPQIPPPNRLRPADSVTIRVEPPEVYVETGGPAVSVSAKISNPRQEQSYEQYNFEILDLDPTWYELDTKGVILARGDSTPVGIKFQVPRRSAEPGDYLYSVRAVSNSNPEVYGYTKGKLKIASPPTLQMELHPASVTGETGQYTIDLGNGPAGVSIVQFDCRDPSGMLEFTINPDRVRLEPSADKKVELTVGVRPEAVGEPRPYPFTLVAKVTGGEEGVLPIEAQAELVYVPPVKLGIRVEFDPWMGHVRDFHVFLTNPTSLTLDVVLEANDPDDGLDFFFHEETDRVQIAREQTVIAKGLVRISAGLPAGNQTIPYRIGAWVRNVDGPGELHEQHYGEMVYEALAAPEKPANPLEHVSLALAPPRAAGNPGRYTVQLENAGPAGVLTMLSAFDPADALELTLDPPQVYLEPGKRGQASLTVVRNDSGAPLSQTVFPFKVRCAAPNVKAEDVLTCEGEYELASAFQAFLVPDTAEGIEGAYTVRLVNGGPTPLPVVLRGSDPLGMLRFQFDPPRSRVGSASEETVRLTVGPNALEPLSEGHHYSFDVICWIPSTNQTVPLQGKLHYVSF